MRGNRYCRSIFLGRGLEIEESLRSIMKMGDLFL